MNKTLSKKVIWMNWCGKTLILSLHYIGQMKDTDPGPHPATTDYSKTSQELGKCKLGSDGVSRGAQLRCSEGGAGPASWIRSDSSGNSGKGRKGTENVLIVPADGLWTDVWHVLWYRRPHWDTKWLFFPAKHGSRMNGDHAVSPENVYYPS